MKLELIQWLDHTSITNSWFSGEAIDKLSPGVLIVSVGWVYKEDKSCIHLVSTISQEKEYSGHTCILKKLIQRRWQLREPNLPIFQGMVG